MRTLCHCVTVYSIGRCGVVLGVEGFPTQIAPSQVLDHRNVVVTIRLNAAVSEIKAQGARWLFLSFISELAVPVL